MKLLSWMLLLLLAITSAACAILSGGNGDGKNTGRISQTASFSIEGKLTREFYLSAGDNVSPVAYHVSVKIKNTGESAIKYDQVIGGFFPKHGPPLTLPTMPYDETKALSQEDYARGEMKVIELVPGAIHRVECMTNGYTFDLLRKAGDAPLQFSVILALKNERIAAPFTTELPGFAQLDKLPLYLIDKSEGQSLSFRNEEPYKYTPVSGTGRTQN